MTVEKMLNVSVLDPVCDSVLDPVWHSVAGSVQNTVRTSVSAIIEEKEY